MRRAAVVVLLAAGVLAPRAAAAPPLVVHADFDTRTVEFGEPVRANVVVQVDRTQVDPDSVRIVDDVSPLTPLTPGRVTRTRRGDTVVIESERAAVCLDEACVAERGEATPSLPHVTVTAAASDGRTLRAGAAWPELHVRGQVTAADLARRRPPFRADTTPAAPSYRLAPSTLARALDALAVVLAVIAVVLGVREARRFVRSRRRAPSADELERALRLTREAQDRPPADRRRALGLLARLLDRRDRRLAGAASDLAWRRPVPEPDSLADLVGDVEREVST